MYVETEGIETHEVYNPIELAEAARGSVDNLLKLGWFYKWRIEDLAYAPGRDRKPQCSDASTGAKQINTVHRIDYGTVEYNPW